MCEVVRFFGTNPNYGIQMTVDPELDAPIFSGSYHNSRLPRSWQGATIKTVYYHCVVKGLAGSGSFRTVKTVPSRTF